MELPVQITFRNMEGGPFEDLVREQVLKLERYHDRIVSCRVSVEKHGARNHGNSFHVRLDVGIPGHEFIVNQDASNHASDSGDVQSAILHAFAAMRRQIQDYVRIRRGEVKRHAGAGG